MKKLLALFLVLCSTIGFCAPQTILPGATQLQLYLPALKGKRVGIFVNQTSYVGHKHLLDVLREHGIHVTKIFAPEHGFRGDADAGAHVKNSFDAKTAIPIVSLYGHKLRPTAEDLQDVDILLFDIQDVGVRFYTYISSLQKLMEAAIENHKPLIVLDRPNPNGFYVDGPVLDKKNKSFIGMQAIPVVYGMTEGEYANMLVGEEWLEVTPKARAHDLQLTVIPCVHYTHSRLYELPIRPSPNLPTMQSIYLYPSIALMDDATVISVGRGTGTPFQVFGHPDLRTDFHFTPHSRPGALSPQYQNKTCYGWHVFGSKKSILKSVDNQLQIKYLIRAYHAFPDKDHFFGESVAKVLGNNALVSQLAGHVSEQDIRRSWEPRLQAFKVIRKKYLLYPDFK